jgi:hypothetical protein
MASPTPLRIVARWLLLLKQTEPSDRSTRALQGRDEATKRDVHKNVGLLLEVSQNGVHAHIAPVPENSDRSTQIGDTKSEQGSVYRPRRPTKNEDKQSKGEKAAWPAER